MSHLIRASYSNVARLTPALHQEGSRSSNKIPIAFIAGAGAKTARMAISMLLRSGVRVVALSGQEFSGSGEGLHVKRINRNQLNNPDYMKQSINEAFKEMDVSSVSHVIGINLIGGAVAPAGSTLEELNHDIPLSFFKGLQDAAKDKTDRVSLAQLSSIAITINGDTDCLYVDSKKKAEESLFQLNPKGTVVSFRPGIICPVPGRQYDTTHDYSVEQLARLPVIPVLGSGGQIMQPVSEECLYTAMINAMLTDEVIREIINAVGSDAITQKELFAHLAELGKTNFIHVPTAFAHVVAKYFPKGRIAPYAIKIFEELDTNRAKNLPICGERFGHLVGKRPLGFKEIYENSTIVTKRAPIGEHVLEMLQSPRQLLEVAGAAVSSAKDFYFTSNEIK